MSGKKHCRKLETGKASEGINSHILTYRRGGKKNREAKKMSSPQEN